MKTMINTCPNAFAPVVVFFATVAEWIVLGSGSPVLGSAPALSANRKIEQKHISNEVNGKVVPAVNTKYRSSQTLALVSFFAFSAHWFQPFESPASTSVTLRSNLKWVSWPEKTGKNNSGKIVGLVEIWSLKTWKFLIAARGHDLFFLPL